MTEATAIRQAAEQPMQGAHFGRNRIAHRSVNRQLVHLLADGFGQTRRGLAGRRCQADAQRLALFDGRGLQ